MPTDRTIGLVSPLPPQVGGVVSVAEWLLAHADQMECRYETFDLERHPDTEMGGRFRIDSIPRQLRLFVRLIRWLPGAPPLIHYCVSCSRPGLWRDAAFIGLLRLSGRRTIAHIHGAGLAAAVESPIRSVLLRLVRRWTIERIAISPTSSRMLARIGVSSRCILNPLRFEPEAVPARNGEGGRFRLLFVGAYGRRKGCPELVDALARVRSRGLDAKLRIVGKEDHKGDREAMTTKVRGHRLDSAVEFAGVRAANEMPSVYQEADVICLPSRQEGLPMALLEAMAFGLPVIATPVGGVPDLVEGGQTGILVAPGDVDGLTEAIATLAGSAELRRGMGAKGRERVFSLASSGVIAAQWSELYDELTRASG